MTTPDHASGLPLDPTDPAGLPEELFNAAGANPTLHRVLVSLAAPGPDGLPEDDDAVAVAALTSAAAFSGLLRRLRDRQAVDEWGMGSSRVELLITVARLGEPTMSELARTLSVTPRAITRLVDGLEAEGYVSRERQADDARVFRVRCTEAAMERVIRGAVGNIDNLLALTEGIPAEDLRTTLRTLMRLTSATRSQLGLA